MDTKLKTIDDLLKESFEEIKQNLFHRVETDSAEDDFFKLSVGERLDLLPF